MRLKKKLILDANLAKKKLDRMAYQILEANYDESEVILIGIANKGFKIAKLLGAVLKKISNLKVVVIYVKMNKCSPTEGVELEKELEFDGKSVIIVDDVGNTGRTIFFAMLPLYKFKPKKIQTAVLIDRMHKSYPISANFVGLNLATTLNQEVIVEMDSKNKFAEVYLT